AEELQAWRECICGEAGRFPRVRQCGQGARRVLGAHQRTAPWERQAVTGKAPLRILLLEDDPGDAQLIRDILEDDLFDCEVTRVQTRDEFVAALDNQPIDLILADHNLPSFDGLSALKLVRETGPDLPFIFVSGIP